MRVIALTSVVAFRQSSRLFRDPEEYPHGSKKEARESFVSRAPNTDG